MKFSFSIELFVYCWLTGCVYTFYLVSFCKLWGFFLLFRYLNVYVVNSVLYVCMCVCVCVCVCMYLFFDLLAFLVRFLPRVYLFILLRYNLHAIKFTLLNCTSQWFLVYSQSCATITISNSRTFSSSPEETSYRLVVTLYSHFTTASGHHGSTFCLYGFACSGHFTYMESYNMWPLCLKLPRFLQ